MLFFEIKQTLIEIKLKPRQHLTTKTKTEIKINENNMDIKKHKMTKTHTQKILKL